MNRLNDSHLTAFHTISLLIVEDLRPLFPLLFFPYSVRIHRNFCLGTNIQSLYRRLDRKFRSSAVLSSVHAVGSLPLI